MNDELTMVEEENEDTLAHYGVKGQKWGQRNYQNPDGTYTELGKERRRVDHIRAEKKKKEDANANSNGIKDSEQSEEEFYDKIGGKAYKDMTRKELRAAKKRARHNEAERRAKREFNQEKKSAIESGDMAFISKNISKFTNDEIDEAVYRYNKMQNLRQLEQANKKDSGYYADKAIEWLNRGAKASNAIANISNSFNDMAKKSAERRKTQIEADKADTELEYLKNPKAKPLTKKEELALEKDKLELDWMKDPKSKPMTEQQELELQWLKDPKSKPKTRKEEIEEEKAEQDLKWFYKPEDKPIDEAQSLKNAKQALENRKLISEYEQTEADTKWKKFAFSEKRKAYDDYKNGTIDANELKNKFSIFSDSGKGGGGGGNNKPKKDDFAKEMRKIRPDLTDDDIDEMYKNSYKGKSNSSSLTGWFSKKNKEDVKGTDYDLDDKRVNIITRKYLDKLKSSPKDYFKENQVRSDQWKKDMKKHDSDVIDKWVKDMKKKYMKEQKLDSKAAEEKAEAYVDAWLDAYDEGDV